MRIARLVTFFGLVIGLTVVSQSPTPRVSAVDIPEYTSLLPLCSDPGNTTVSCHWVEPGSVDSPVVIFASCDVVADPTKYCYDLKVNGAAAPSTLRVVARMSAYKTHDASVGNAQYEAGFHLFYVPSGNTFNTSTFWGWGDRPRDQSTTGGQVDLSPVLKSTDVVKLTVKMKMHKLPQFNVFVADNASANFALTGTDLVMTVEGTPARVAIENATQHINFDTEKSDDTTKPWTDRCGVPSMKFVVCNVDKAESNPLIYYFRSSTMVNSPAGDTPGPIWVATNATYFHFPSVEFDSNGNKQIKVKVAAPHLLADGTTVNSGGFRTFLPNGLLEQWKIDKTESALNKALAASVKKAGKEEVVDRTFTISDIGVTITFPNLTYSSPEVFVTSVSNIGGSQNANQVYAALLAGASGTTSGSTTTGGTGSTVATPTSTTTGKSLKKGSTTLLTKLIRPTTGIKPIWSVKGACRIISGKLAAVTKGKTCTLTMKQKNPKTKLTTTKTLAIAVT